MIKLFPSLKQEVQNNIYYTKKEFKNSTFRIIIFQGTFKSLITVKKENPNSIKNFKGDIILFYIEDNKNIDFYKWDESQEDSLKNVKFMDNLMNISENQEQMHCRDFFHLSDSKEPENIYFYDTISFGKKERWILIITEDVRKPNIEDSIGRESVYMALSLLNGYFK